MKLLEALISYRKVPENLIENDIVLFENAIQESIEAVKLLTLRDVNVSSEGLIFKGFTIFKESFRDFSYPSYVKSVKFNLTFLVKNYFHKKKKIFKEDYYVWITDEISYTYFHWLADALPRLFATLQVIEKPKIILPYSFKKNKFIEESLKVFPVLELMFIKNNEVYNFNKLLLPTHVAKSGNYNDCIMKEIRQKYRSYYLEKQTLFLGEKIYISRAKATRRKILNEQELTDLLKEYGFTPVVFEDFSFDEQVSIVFNAKYLVSNHGAGLTNMLFMEAGTSVFELRREGDKHNNCYFSLASALDIKYYYQNCKTETDNTDSILQLDSEPTMEEWESFTFANIIIDLKKIKENLNHMLNLS
ncbi:capsular polysaccharide biosynthesis protein-like protein [Kalymmatonema gypsitolerans NIES-4073]|nr:capsular polysaccharide biosynthesis protein-like protein [Scytonema sp. NIES-4073]